LRVEESNRYAMLRKEKGAAKLDNLVALPASGLGEGEILGWTRLLRIAVLARIRVGILLLVEIAKGVVDLAMLALICTDYYKLIMSMCTYGGCAYCT
jgi:hypothetical protein